MLRLKKIIADNIKTHIHTEMDFPETGLIRIAGANNDGKSAIFDSLFKILRGEVSRKPARLGIIRYDQPYAELRLILYDTSELLCHITIEAKDTYFELKRVNGEIIKRYLADKTWSNLLSEIGLHYDKDYNMSLNIYTTYSPLLFVNTTHIQNMGILNYAATDERVERSKENLTTLLKKSQDTMKLYDANVEKLKAQKEILEVYNEEYEQEQINKYTCLLNTIKNLRIPRIQKLEGTSAYKSIVIMDTSKMWLLFNKLKQLKIISIEKYRTIDLLQAMPNLLELSKTINTIHEYKVALKNNKCPTCGGVLID